MIKAPSGGVILCVDDDEDDSILLESAIGSFQRNLNVVRIADPAEAVRRLKSAGVVPDVIFLDLNMPMLNGFECLEVIRGIDALTSVPVTILTTSSSERDYERAMELGATRFVTKPNTYEELCNIAGTVISEDLPVAH